MQGFSLIPVWKTRTCCSEIHYLVGLGDGLIAVPSSQLLAEATIELYPEQKELLLIKLICKLSRLQTLHFNWQWF